MSAALLFVLPPTGETSVSQFELDLDSFIRKGQHAAVEQIGWMLQDLRKSGPSCRFLRMLKGTSLWELKPSTRGGQKGGARVYLAFSKDKGILVLNAEVKRPDDYSPSLNKLRQARRMLEAYASGTVAATQAVSSGTEDVP